MRSILLCAAFTALFSQTSFAQTPKPKATAPVQKVVTGTVLLNEKTAPDFKSLLATLKTDWKFRTDSVTTKAKTLVFTTPGATITLSYMDYPVAPADIKAAANLSWIWRTAAQEAGRHQAQVVISVIGSTSRALELHKLFTRVAGGVLENTKASGIYLTNQYLLLPKGFYTAAAHNLQENNSLPVYCWVHFGMTDENGKSGGYTYGLQEFGLPEMEVVNSSRSVAEVHAVLYDAAATVVQYGTKVQEGQVLTTGEEQKLTVHLSPSKAVQGLTTAKLDW